MSNLGLEIGLEIGLGAVGILALVGVATTFMNRKEEASERYSDSDDFRTPSENENRQSWENSREQAYLKSQERNEKTLSGRGKRKTTRNQIKKSKRG